MSIAIQNTLRAAVRTGLPALTATMVLLSGEHAGASPNYPAVVQEVADAPCAPQCVACHNNPQGGLGTAINGTELGKASGRYGVAGKLSDDEVRTGFENMKNGYLSPRNIQEPPSDVDEPDDGITDFQELAQGIDPSTKGELCAVHYGCGARVEPKGQLSKVPVAISALAAVVMGFVLRLGRRRNRD